MKIGIDTFGCDHGKSNAGAYLISLLKNLDKINMDVPLEFELFGPESDKYDYEMYFPESNKSGDFEKSSNVKVNFVSVKLPESKIGVKLWHSFGCNYFFKKQGYRAVIFLTAEQYLPIRCKVPSIVIVNELLTVRFNKLPFFSRLRFNISLKHVNKIIVPSQFVKKDLKLHHIKAERISVIHNGLDHSVFYPRAGSELDDAIESDIVDIKPFAIQKPYFIYVSKMSSESKRHCELVKAFCEFKERTELPHRLVLAGGDGECSVKIKRTISESKYASDIFITGYYPHENYPELYAGSEGCIYPSVCEGVGMPVIEAMSMRVPVACAKNGAIPEIAGEYAIYFDGDSIIDMESAIEKLATEDSASKAKRLDNAVDWAARFTWEKTTIEIANETRNIILSKKKK